MQKTFCDRCKKETPPHWSMAFTQPTHVEYTAKSEPVISDELNTLEYDLCHGCAEMVEELLSDSEMTITPQEQDQ